MRGAESAVVVDLRPLSNAHSRRGIGRYISQLIGDPLPHGYVAVREVRSWSPPLVRSAPGSIVLHLPPRPRMRLDPLGARLVRGTIERLRPHLVHLTDPYGYDAAPRGVQLLVTLYDLILLDQPGRLPTLFTRGVRSLANRADVRWMAISATTRDAAVARLGLDPEAVHVLPPGPTVWPTTTSHPEATLLVVGAVDEHKRPDHALSAARAAGLPIRFAGRHDPSLLDHWGISDGERLPDLDDAALGARIRGAIAVVHASRAEGFGLPVLEALSLGTPVVAYDLPVTREIVGPGYPLVAEVEGSEGLARLAREVMDPERRAEVVASAADSLSRFSWERSRASLRSLWSI